MTNKLLIICGPTATGKTSLGINLAKKFNGEIISADSRQVYRNMDIGTGKDLPVNSKLQITNNELGYYSLDDVRIYGYDLVDPKEEFSISQYLKFAKKCIDKIEKDGKLPIIVGGTGLYIKAIVDGIPTIDIPRNIELREMLSKKTVDELYENLSQMDSVRSALLNASDKKNPRRLIRAVEVAQYSIDHPGVNYNLVNINHSDTLFIGLTAEQKILEARINKRVEDRVELGFKDEVEKIINSGVDWNDQSMMSLGYRQWRDFVEGAVDIDTAIDEWKKEERKYSKRQLVWFNKEKRINWFDVESINFQEKVENMIEKWYYINNSDA